MLDFATPWTVACQDPLTMEFSGQKYLSGLLFISLGDLPDLEIEPGFPALQADSLPFVPLLAYNWFIQTQRKFRVALSYQDLQNKKLIWRVKKG